MPWSNEGGGGNQGPWGQGPRRPQGPGPRGSGQPPDLDEILRRAREQFRNLLPGSIGIWPVALVAIVVFWLFQAVYVVQPDEEGVVLRFGKFAGLTGPGLHMIKWPIETVETPRTASVNIATFGISGNSSDPNSEGLMLAGDQNIVDIEFTVLWNIADARSYLFNVANPEQLLRVVAESSMREYVGRSRADEVRTKGREAAQVGVMKLIQDTLNAYKAGIDIQSVQLNKAEPPAPVMDAFAEVNRAQQDSASQVNKATQYAFQRQGQANGEAAKIRQDADAYKGRVVAEAQGEAQRFLSVYDQYKIAKDVTRRRIYIETLESVLGGSKKLIIEQGAAGSGVVPYLPLPELKPTDKQGTAP
ncbi:MAG: FtsH protease activity modulator HflK [Rhizobiales bacterium]|nr:FtsH protease activity modulator HflK [Hyphomicrobiales bacterium]MBI3673979.1 FtsH protease activity modulator HflK [Hyphomicrobiales bacterium]